MATLMFTVILAVRFYYHYEEGYIPNIPFLYSTGALASYGIGF